VAPGSTTLNVVYIGDAISGPDSHPPFTPSVHTLRSQVAPGGTTLNVVYIGDAISGPDGVGTGVARLSAAASGAPPASDQMQRLLDFGSRTCTLEAGSAEEAALWVRTINDEIWRSDAHFKVLETPTLHLPHPTTLPYSRET
jgi:hypothetical protein